MWNECRMYVDYMKNLKNQSVYALRMLKFAIATNRCVERMWNIRNTQVEYFKIAFINFYAALENEKLLR